jgi:N-acetyl-D-muramate 6-phosphate phosphatase
VTAARVDVVLFDLDGTLIDSAPDLAGAANDLRAADGLPPLPLSMLRPMVGAGARGMVGVAFGLKPGDDRYDTLRSAFLARYAERLLDATHIFDDMAPVLDRLDAQQVPWGIVTNKVMHLAHPIAVGLGLAERASVLIAGDSTPFAKPHPEPLFEAARRVGTAPHRCVYVGDDARDIQAGLAAGMPVLAAGWGYLGEGEPIHAWGADAVIDHPSALLQWLRMP